MTTPDAVCWKNSLFPVVIKNSCFVKMTRGDVVVPQCDNLVWPSLKKVKKGESISDQVWEFQQQINLNSEPKQLVRGEPRSAGASAL